MSNIPTVGLLTLNIVHGRFSVEPLAQQSCTSYAALRMIGYRKHWQACYWHNWQVLALKAVIGVDGCSLCPSMLLIQKLGCRL